LSVPQHYLLSQTPHHRNSFTMFFSKALIVACSAIAAIAAPTDAVKRESGAMSKRATGSSTGTSGGFYYSYWTDG
jgi:endo-1,4-beta-xylanase